MWQCHNVKLRNSSQVRILRVSGGEGRLEFALPQDCDLCLPRILSIDLSGSNCSAIKSLESRHNQCAVPECVKHNFWAIGGRRPFDDPNFAFLTVRTIFV